MATELQPSSDTRILQNHRTTDVELEAILTSFDTNYVWNYGSVKEGLRGLYEKAKREQWNATTQLAWDTEVDPESEIMPSQMNPLADFGPFLVESDAAGVALRIDLPEVALELDQGSARYRHLDFRGNGSAVSDGSGAIVSATRLALSKAWT